MEVEVAAGVKVVAGVALNASGEFVGVFVIMNGVYPNPGWTVPSATRIYVFKLSVATPF